MCSNGAHNFFSLEQIIPKFKTLLDSQNTASLEIPIYKINPVQSWTRPELTCWASLIMAADLTLRVGSGTTVPAVVMIRSNEYHKHKEVSSRLPTLVREQNSTIWGAHQPTGGVIEAPS